MLVLVLVLAPESERLQQEPASASLPSRRASPPTSSSSAVLAQRGVRRQEERQRRWAVEEVEEEEYRRLVQPVLRVKESKATRWGWRGGVARSEERE